MDWHVAGSGIAYNSDSHIYGVVVSALFSCTVWTVGAFFRHSGRRIDTVISHSFWKKT